MADMEQMLGELNDNSGIARIDYFHSPELSLITSIFLLVHHPSNRSRTKGKSVKRARNSTGGSGAGPNGNHSRSTSEASTDNDEENESTSHDKSPLSKRRRLAKSRSGLSKLKESETIHSGNDSEENAEEKNPRRRKVVDGNQTGSELGDEDTMGEDQIAASQDTDGSEMDQSFLRQLEDDLELELGEDGGEE